MKIISIFILIVFISIIQTRVIEITTNNVQLILKTTPHILLLLHNPRCVHSKSYAKQFLQVKALDQMGIVDCQKQTQLCNFFNITLFPTLVKLTNNSLLVLDEQKFLVSEGLAKNNDPKVILNQIISKLKEQDQYAVLILQEQGLPTLEKIENAQQQNIYYIQSPSKLHKFFYNLVGKKIGCWITRLNGQNVDKYYCGNGYRKEEVVKNVQSFKKSRLLKYISTKEGNASNLQYLQLNQMLKDKGRNHQKCRLIYFYSKECEHCQTNDLEKISNILKSLKIQKQFILQMYDLDIEQLPQKLQLKRIPELLQFCQTQTTFYGQLFNQYNLRTFLNRKRTVKQTIIPLQVVQPNQQQQVIQQSKQL